MTFIYTDGMSFIGPGSEWFWTALSGVVLAVTFIAIYRQLRLTRDGEAMRMLDGFYAEWNSERMLRYRLATLRWIAAGRPNGARPRGPLNGIGNFWEKLATLGRRGHLDTVLLWDAFGADCMVGLVRPGAVRSGESRRGRRPADLRALRVDGWPDAGT